MTSQSDIENTVAVNGFDMHYAIRGEGPPLLLLHGFTGSGAGLLQGFHQLSSTHKLIIPDLRGHGRSTNPSRQFTFHQAALDTFALLDHLDILECSAVGFSGGGCALLHMAYQRPAKIKSMALVSATPNFSEPTREIMKQFTLENRTQAEWEGMRALHFQGDDQIRMLWEQARAFSESYDDMNFTSDMLAKIKTKTLIIQGDRDPLYPLEQSVELYKSIPDAYLWVIPGGGHVPIGRDTIAEFIECLEKFILEK